MGTLAGLTNIQVTVTGGRGPVGLNIVGTPANGQFLVKLSSGPRDFAGASSLPAGSVIDAITGASNQAPSGRAVDAAIGAVVPAAMSAANAAVNSATISAAQAAAYAATLAAVAVYPNAAATYLPKGVTAATISNAGTGGTNSTNNAVTWTGGTLTVNPVILYDVVGGLMVNLRPVSPGQYIGATAVTLPTPTLPNAGTGAALALTSGSIIPLAGAYWVVSADGTQLLAYGNNAGAAAPFPFGATQATMPLGAFFAQYLKQSGPRYWNGAALRSIYSQDSSGRISTFEDINGLLYCALAGESPDGSITVGYDAATGKTTFLISSTSGSRGVGGGATIDTTNRQIFYGGRAVVLGQRDSAGQFMNATLSDDTNRFPLAEFENGIGLDTGAETTNYVYSTKLVSGKRVIRQHSKATGIATVFAGTGNNAHPRISLDGTSIVYATDRFTLPNGPIVWASVFQPIGGGREHPMVSHADIMCLGDSLTYGYNANTSYPVWLQLKLSSAGIRVANYGLGGQSTAQMLYRIGGATVPITVTGNTIAAGANNVTALGGIATGTAFVSPGNPEYRFLSHARADAVSSYGTLNGIYGTMVRTVNGSNQEVYTFTPDPAVTQTLPAACAAGSPWQSINDMADKTLLFYGGGNDVLFGIPAATINANIDAIIAYLAPKSRKFIVFTIQSFSTVNAGSTGSGAAQWAVLQAVNTHLRSTYGAGPGYSAYQFANLFDNFTYLAGSLSGGTTTQALTDAGVTPTSQDLTDIGNQCVPTSLRTTGGSTDPIHDNDIGYRMVAQYGVYPILAANGWATR